MSTLEAKGGVRSYTEQLDRNPELADRMAEVHERYAQQRRRRLEVLVGSGAVDDGPRPTGGVGGSRGGVKCLHAHSADALSGNENPIGQSVLDRVAPLSCDRPCVIQSDQGAMRNPDWSAGGAHEGV